MSHTRTKMGVWANIHTRFIIWVVTCRYVVVVSGSALIHGVFKNSISSRICHLIDAFIAHQSIVERIAPKDALMLVEKSHNAYPYSQTELRCPYLQHFFINICTQHVDNELNIENVTV